MALSTDKVKDISKKLQSNKKVVLVGVSGVGKTWTARKVSEFAIKEKLFWAALWVFRKYDEQAIHESIARQLDPLPTAEDWEIDSDIEKFRKADSDKEGEGDSAKKDPKKERGTSVHLKEMIANARNSDKKAGQVDKVLIILDDVQNTTEEEKIILFLENLLGEKVPTFMITRVNEKVTEEEKMSEDGVHEDRSSAGEVIKLEPWSEDDSLTFLREKVGGEVFNKSPMKDLAVEFIGTTKGLPGKVLSLAKAFRYFSNHNIETRIIKRALEELSDGGNYCISKLLKYVYDVPPMSVLVDCCRWQPGGSGSHFFLNRGSIHYTELIAFWIIEGYLGHADSIATAYQKGHSVLMELVDSQVLKTLDSGYVIMDKPIPAFEDYGDRYGFGGIASLGLADLSDECKWEGFGTLTQTDKIIRSIQMSEKDEEIFTLILSGKRCEKIMKILDVLKAKLEKQPQKKNPPATEAIKKDLPVRVLALLNPNLTSLTLPPDMNKLSVLILRSCVFLETLQCNFHPGNLTVLEISNASSLKEMADGFFDNMRQLQCLHLSELTDDKLPSSLYKLEELRWLRLRRCSGLTKLESLKLLVKLLVIDISGATSLGRFKDKTFQHHPNLQILDVSHSGLERLPKFRNLGKLTHLLVSGCKNLTRLPKTVALTSLQTLDVSGCGKLEEFHEDSLQKPDGPKVVDLSGTFLDIIPPKINPRQLFLKDCCQLKELPSLEVLKKLEVLDLSGTEVLSQIDETFFTKLSSLQTLNLSGTSIKDLPPLPEKNNLCSLSLSGCTVLSGIPNGFFEHITSLEHLDLSDTKIEHVPSLSKLSNLSFLSLRNCFELKSLPALDTLTSLEELNLCGISCWREGETNFLKDMSRLRIVDLSESNVRDLPSLSHLITLHKLYLRDCTDLQGELNLKELTTLEVLDIAGTNVHPLTPSGNLKHLLVKGSSDVKDFLELAPTTDQNPQGTPKLNRFEFLDLTGKTKNEGAGSSMSLSKKPESHRWSITNFNKPSRFVSALKLHEILKKERSSQETSFKKFHLCIYPTDRLNGSGDTYYYSNDTMFNDIRFSTANFDNAKGERSLEIHGFDALPEDIEELLGNADYVFLVGNSFKKWSCRSSLKAMKGCWIERCTEMEDVSSSVQEGSFATVAENMETLGISNAISLRNLHCVGFHKLKSLYLDCCPELSTVYLSAELSKNLEVLHVKFCDKLKSLFEETSPEPKLKSLSEDASPEPALQNLTTLYLLELPELEKIGCKLPPLKHYQALECPKLKIEQAQNIRL